MQGSEVERSVIAALNNIAAHTEEWDAVVIIRGGGATSDLQGFDSLLLAENVAQFPLPIITGIGHERDDTVIDLIAHTRVKTPTAAAEFLIHHQEEELDTLEDLAMRLNERTSQMLANETFRLKLLTSKLPNLFSAVRAREEMRLHTFTAALAQNSIRRLEQSKGMVELLHKQLLLFTPAMLEHERKRIELIKSQLHSAHPDRILQLGFSITRLGGKAIRSTDEVKEGDELETTLASGTLKSTITWKRKK